jgi:hypothetical protein
MATLTTEKVHVLVLDDDELELIHNLLFSGPRLGHGYYSELALNLIEEIAQVRGEIDFENRIFDYGDEEGHIWLRHEPVSTT